MDSDLTTSTSEIEENSDEGETTLSELSDRHLVQHLSTGFSATSALSAVDDSLPYHQLGGPGLERLCYSLISSRGSVPRYFGNPGQEQYGIDLMTTDGDNCVVYQCKNVNSFTRQNMGKALRLFEKKWLGHAQLPRPTKFVLCCPLPLRERKLNEEWTILERKFFEDTGVRIEVWDKEYLDSQLKNLPDIVADMFSDETAERFCELDDWNEDLLRPVRLGSGEPMIKRYLKKKAEGRIYLDARLTEDFTRRLERHRRLLILGLPGSGKTITGLALAESFRAGSYRLFYLNMRRDLSEDMLVKGIRRRLSRPTIFLIDDCHGKYEILEGVQDRLQEVLARQPGRAMMVHIARTTPTPEGMARADRSDFVEEFRKAETVMEFRSTPEVFASIAALTKPDLRELSEERLNRIFTATGRDLFLLDQLIDIIKSPDEIDRLTPEHLFEGALLRYFGQPTVHRPGFMMLTALAQFEIAPAAADFPYDLRREDPRAAQQLLVEADRPVRYFFLHSSAAELVFRALAWNNRIDNHAEAAALKLIEFFSSRPATDPQLPADLSSVLRNRLKLRRDEAEEHLLKSRFLADENIFALVAGTFEHLSLNVIALLLNILKSTDAATLELYRGLVKRKIDDGTALKALAMSFPTQFVQLIKNEYPLWYASLREQFADQGLLQLVRTKELRRLLRILVTSAKRDFISDNALDSVSDEFGGLIGRTIASGYSIANIHQELRELKNTNVRLLEKLESKIGAQRYLHLIVSAGTIFELLMLIKYSSLSMAARLIEALDDEMLESLIAKTITTGRSIGTIHLMLRDLKEANIDLLEKLESKIGAQRYLHLIVSAGTIFELFRAIQDSSPSMSLKMIRALDDKTIKALIEETITSGRSIGTLPFTLRQLKIFEPDELNRLERLIGVDGWWKLILANGKINVLASLMKYMDTPFRQEMVRASLRITTAQWESLLLRGDLSDLTVFVRVGEGYSPKMFTNALIKRLSQSFEKLIGSADWSALNASVYRLSESPDSQLKHHLQTILDKRLSEVDIDSLRFDTFEEAALCIATLWQKLSSKRDKLVRSIFNILPAEINWYKDESFLRAARKLLFALAASPSQHDVEKRLLSLCNNRNVAALFAHAETLEILLYLWNLYSLWFKCERVVKKDFATSFAAFLDPEIRACVNRILNERLRSNANQLDMKYLVSLCGFLYVGGLADFSPEDKAAWLPDLPPFEELLSKSEGMKSFLVSSFFLIGLGWIFDRQRDIPGFAFSRAISKAIPYEVSTEAFKNLHRLLSKRIR